MSRRLLLATLALAFPALAAGQAKAPVDDFAFVQISDVHVSPHVARTGAPGALRGAESVAWVCEQAVGPQKIRPFKITTPAPAFALATGDLTEYGVIDDTWSLFEKAFASLPYPLYVTPGNHDNTWVAMYHILRERYGGADYSFDQFGCHFVCICSASPQEPVPSIDATTRTWLKRDLESIPPGTPVFIGLHHPPYGTDLASPAEYDTLFDLLLDYNVVLMLYGHGHAANHRDMDGIDGVMGGSTFGRNAGYAVISAQDQMLRVAYHYFRKPVKGKQSTLKPGWKTVLEKPLQSNAPRRLFRVSAAAAKGGEPSVARRLPVAVEPMSDAAGAEELEFTFEVDGAEAAVEHGAVPEQPVWVVDTAKLTDGRHLLTVRGNAADGSQDIRAMTFRVVRQPDPLRWHVELPGAVKAGTVVAGDKLIVPRTDGIITALDRSTGAASWEFKTGGEILGTPAWSGQVLVFGSGDAKVYGLDGSGTSLWTFDAGLPVYGAPLIDGETVYIGDNGGRMHALDLKTGEKRWTFSRADYSIECQPHLWGDLIVFGAWDGYLYALRPADGELQWKVLGPKASDGKSSQYYAPADCSPATVGDTLFACDRGYFLGRFDRTGVQGPRVDEGIAGIAADLSGQYIYARSKDDRVCKFNGAGERLWDRALPAGRFPIPPTPAGDAVYVCSNKGLLSVLDAADGRLRWQYQVTPGFYVMAPVTVDDAGVCYVAGMDGTVTALTSKSRPKRRDLATD